MRKCHICNLHIATFDFEDHIQKHLDEAARQTEAVRFIYYLSFTSFLDFGIFIKYVKLSFER